MRENDKVNASASLKTKRVQFEIKGVELALEQCIDQAFLDIIMHKAVEDKEKNRMAEIR